MTSNQPTGPFPDPIVNETRVRHGGGADLIIGDRTKNDYINLTTGEVRVARIGVLPHRNGIALQNGNIFRLFFKKF